MVHSVLHVVQLGEGYAPQLEKGVASGGTPPNILIFFFELRKNVPNDLINQLIDDL